VTERATHPRILVTGIGCVGPFGLGIGQFEAGLRAGVPAMAQHRPGFAPPDFTRLVGRVPEDALAGQPGPAGGRLTDRATFFAVLAAREAVTGASPLNPDRTGVLVGAGGPGIETYEAGYHRLYAEGRERAHPLSVLRGMANAPAAQVSLELGLRGPAAVLSSACASGTHALGEAMWMLRTGRADAMLAIGTEACLTYATLRAWDALHVLSPDGCRPFSIGRNGLVLAEGAAALLLETEAAAAARGAQPIAELAGYAASADAGDVIQPEVGRMAWTIAAALADAGVAPEAVEHVNAHGTGTVLNDRAEAAALHLVFGPRASRIPVSATKSLHGHALGAAGAIEAVAAILALTRGFLPPTAGWLGHDPDFDLDVVPNVARSAAVRIAVSNSFAFGGLNAVACFRRL
jgi:nodulation protein E